jgi:hypothetical protein
MPTVDLRGIHFRSYLPQFTQGGDDDYDPIGPDDASITPGGVDLCIIKFRAWEDADLANDTEGGSAGAGSSGSIGGGGTGSFPGGSGGPGPGGGGGTGGSGGGTPPAVDCMVPSEDLYPSEDHPCAPGSTETSETISFSSSGFQTTIVEATSDGTQTVTSANSTQSINETSGSIEGAGSSGTGAQAISEATAESLGNTGTGTHSIAEDIEGGESGAYGEGLYGEGPYGE